MSASVSAYIRGGEAEDAGIAGWEEDDIGGSAELLTGRAFDHLFFPAHALQITELARSAALQSQFRRCFTETAATLDATPRILT